MFVFRSAGVREWETEGSRRIGCSGDSTRGVTVMISSMDAVCLEVAVLNVSGRHSRKRWPPFVARVAGARKEQNSHMDNQMQREALTCSKRDVRQRMILRSSNSGEDDRIGRSQTECESETVLCTQALISTSGPDTCFCSSSFLPPWILLRLSS